jgi:acyl carrier protein
LSDEAIEEAMTNALLSVLEEVVGCESVLPTDDFYLIGGHSLLIVRIVGLLRERFNVELDQRAFGVNSQIAALIAACRPCEARPGSAGGPGFGIPAG